MSPSPTTCQLQVSHDPCDAPWDAFVEQTPGGHHIQTSMWSLVRAESGWKATRITVWHGDNIVAGAQLFVKPLLLGQSIGYVPRGPLLAPGTDALRDLVLERLEHVAREEHVCCLIVQPPGESEPLVDLLPQRGFKLEELDVAAPTATVRIDLSLELEALFSRIHSKTRQNLRYGLKRGCHVREGATEDLEILHRLATATARRRGFDPCSLEYLRTLWEALHPSGHAALLIVEHEGEPLCGHIVILFQDCVYTKIGGWSGEHAKLHPNEILEWESIEWAKRKGFRWYDLEGININAARAAVRGERLPPALLGSPSAFKLKFGGDVVFLPGAYARIYNPMLRWSIATTRSMAHRFPVVERMLNHLRTG